MTNFPVSKSGWRTLAINRGFKLAIHEHQIDQLKRALKKSSVALDDWLNTYARELCDENRVNEAFERISQYGTAGYIAALQETNRKLLE